MGHAIVWFVSFMVAGIVFRAWGVWIAVPVFIVLMLIGTLVRVGWKDVPEESKPTGRNMKDTFMEGYREQRSKGNDYDHNDKEQDR